MPDGTFPTSVTATTATAAVPWLVLIGRVFSEAHEERADLVDTCLMSVPTLLSLLRLEGLVRELAEQGLTNVVLMRPAQFDLRMLAGHLDVTGIREHCSQSSYQRWSAHRGWTQLGCRR